MELILRDSIVEEVLSAWQAPLGAAGVPYRGHVYRVLNAARQLLGTSAHDRALAVAAAFHDIGVWSDNTFDYLGPSIVRAREHIHTRSRDVDEQTIVEAIDNHHRLRRVALGTDGERRDVVEMFRRADLVDVSGGWLRAGLNRSFVRELTAAFPYAGFHLLLVRTGFSWFSKHPLRPLPMMRY